MIARRVAIGVAACIAIASVRAEDDSALNAARKHVEPILQAVAEGKKFASDATERVPDLIVIVERGRDDEVEFALRALARVGPKANASIAAIVRKLNDPCHATRGAAVDALVAIGDTGIPSVRAALRAPEGRIRAAAAEVIARLHRLTADERVSLSKDADPRVRAAVVNALSEGGKIGVGLLTDMLKDPDPAVAAQAARALQTSRADPAAAVEGLTRLLVRPELAATAAEALSMHGVAARQAVPALLRAHPAWGRRWRDEIEAALDHIGPPLVADIPAACALLMRDADTRILAARTLAWLGTDGRPAADALEAVAEKSIDEYVKLRQTARSKKADPTDNSGRVFVSAEDCASALWSVTRDTPRFLRLAERMAIAADVSIVRFNGHELTADLSAEDFRLLEPMLRSEKLGVRLTAMAVLYRAGVKAAPLRQTVFEIAAARDALARDAICTLAKMGPGGKDPSPFLLAKLGDGTLTLGQFADAAARLKVRNAETQAVLERGLADKDQWAAAACAAALCATSADAARTARALIDAAGRGTIEHHRVISALSELRGADVVVVPYLLSQIDSSDMWPRHDALVLLGRFGKQETAVTARIRKRLGDEARPVYVAAAIALYRMTNDPAELVKQLDRIWADGEPWDRLETLADIAGLGKAGGPAVRYAAAELRRSPPISPDSAINALQAIGTDEAVAALRSAAESSDWQIRSRAAEALRRVSKATTAGGK